MNKGLVLLLVGFLAGCASSQYQAYEGRTAQIVEGQGGTKEVVEGYDVWDNGTPPRRYQVLGVVKVDSRGDGFSKMAVKPALVAKIKEVGGNAAIVMDSSGGGRTVGFGASSTGQMSTFVGVSPTAARWQIIKYLD